MESGSIVSLDRGNPFPESLLAYCLQCKTGKEIQLASFITAHYPPVTAFSAVQEKHRSLKGVKDIVRHVMLPGYVFLYAKEEIPHRGIMMLPNVQRFLKYEDEGGFALRGADAGFAGWLYQNEGVFSCSKAIQSGTQVKIISGPLSDHIGRVMKIDKHNRNICLSISFDAIQRVVWMPFEWVTD